MPVQQQRQYVAIAGVVAASGDDVNVAVPVAAAEQPQPGIILNQT